MKILIINGPNLNMLGERETSTYGTLTLEEIQQHTESRLEDKAELTWWQSNSETEIIEKVQSLTKDNFDALVINPAAYSHTSVAILDALVILKIPIAEVHLSNVYRRESFRQNLLTAKASSIIMSGLGKNAYYYGVMAILDMRDERK